MCRLPIGNIRRFMLAGNATLTVQNPKTGNRYTYKICQITNEDGEKSPWFVKVLTGEDNTSSYTYIGFIRDGKFVCGRKSRISAEAPSVRAFAWLWRNADDPSPAEVYHEGKCGKCGRKLTVPESIKTGFGPVCAASL